MNTADLASALTGTVYNRVVQLKEEISAAIATTGKRASGRTQESLKVLVDGNTVTLVGRAFFPALEYGSSNWTGKTGIHCTFAEFKEIIRAWANAKGLTFGQAKEHERAIGAITSSIIRRGTKEFRMGNYTDVYDTLITEALLDIGEKVQLITAEAVDVVVDRWAMK